MGAVSAKDRGEAGTDSPVAISFRQAGDFPQSRPGLLVIRGDDGGRGPNPDPSPFVKFAKPSAHEIDVAFPGGDCP